ncbi:MAG TPA: hypothetical protein VIL29_07490 [Pseudothermotoga sp.]|jgi:hypothetical protein
MENNVTIEDVGEYPESVLRTRNLHKSAWFFTVNSNKRATPENIEYVQDIGRKLKQAFSFMITNHIKDILLIKDREDAAKWERNRDAAYRELIKKVDVKLAIEVGKDIKGRRVHLHALLTITHTTAIHLNYKLIQKILRDLLCKDLESPFRVEGMCNIHINIKFVQSQDSLIDYLSKEPIHIDSRKRTRV